VRSYFASSAAIGGRELGGRYTERSRTPMQGVPPVAPSSGDDRLFAACRDDGADEATVAATGTVGGRSLTSVASGIGGAGVLERAQLDRRGADSLAGHLDTELRLPCAGRAKATSEPRVCWRRPLAAAALQ
jgi:hypothetical protein